VMCIPVSVRSPCLTGEMAHGTYRFAYRLCATVYDSVKQFVFTYGRQIDAALGQTSPCVVQQAPAACAIRVERKAYRNGRVVTNFHQVWGR
jgi:hypothetical protein